jgi:hypothetical protein
MKRNPNSNLAWRRNGMYGRLARNKVDICDILTNYPILLEEGQDLRKIYDTLEFLIKSKKISDERFGRLNHFNKYHNKKV